MPYVFISYSHKDTAYVAKLAASLEERGIDVWMDDEIDYGDRYPRVIQEHLDSCAAVVLVMSKHSTISEWVSNELAYAKNKEKTVLPLLLSGDLWLPLATTQHADVSHGGLPPDEFFERLQGILGPAYDLHQAEPAEITDGAQAQKPPTPRPDDEEDWPQSSPTALAVQKYLADVPFVYLSPHIPARNLEGATKKLLPMAGPHDKMLALIDAGDNERGVAIFETYFVYRSDTLFSKAKRYLFKSLTYVSLDRWTVVVKAQHGGGTGSRKVFIRLRNPLVAKTFADFLNAVSGNRD